jgi:hypothetical protein
LRKDDMSLKTNLGRIILLTIFLQTPFSFSGEVYRWTDERGTIHFTDDVSKIPKPYSDQAERMKVPEEIFKEADGIGQSEGKSDRVNEYLKNIEKRIEVKKGMEKRISELEKELKLSQERLKRIEEYEKENDFFYIPYKDPKTGKWIPMASPYYEEKRRLKKKIESIQTELKSLQEKLSDLVRSL